MMQDEFEQGQAMRRQLDTQRMDARLEDTLRNFRTSVHAWSQATLPSARMVAIPASHPRVWQRTLAWALGVVLTAGTASGALYERHHRQVLRDQARQRELQRERDQTLAAKQAADMDELLARVDKDVSQEVPDALEPLAQMMTVGGSGK